MVGFSVIDIPLFPIFLSNFVGETRERRKNMKLLFKIPVIALLIIAVGLPSGVNAQQESAIDEPLSLKRQKIITIAAYTANGELQDLKSALYDGLDTGLSINEIKEVIVHLYAYCGFPRSIRGLQTFMEVLDERKAKGIHDKTGAAVSPINQELNKY
jgi:alkylhydroperoxidase/carboxymuconolactone decarboxylase family protein YurZ